MSDAGVKSGFSQARRRHVCAREPSLKILLASEVTAKVHTSPAKSSIECYLLGHGCLGVAS